jgi:hypothetical protein
MSADSGGGDPARAVASILLDGLLARRPGAARDDAAPG